MLPMKLSFYIDFLHPCINLSLTALSSCSREKFQIVAPGKFIKIALDKALGSGKGDLSRDLISLGVGELETPVLQLILGFLSV